MDAETIDRIIEMAWQDWVPFDAIEAQFGLSEKEVIRLMRREMKPSSFRMWRKRVQNRPLKHSGKRSGKITKFRSQQHRSISGNKIS